MNDGIVVIPAKFEGKIMDAIIEKMNMESKVAVEISKYSNTDDIISNIGAF